MNKMKKIGLKSAVLALLGMSVASCGDFLEVPPLTMVYEDNYWEEKADVDQIVTGCYTRMQDDDFMRRLFIWGEVRSDNVQRGVRPGLQSTSAEGYILSENILSTNGYTDWSSFYSVIDRCNLVIEKAPQVAEVDPNYLPSDVQATIAEVTAIRAGYGCRSVIRTVGIARIFVVGVLGYDVVMVFVVGQGELAFTMSHPDAELAAAQ